MFRTWRPATASVILFSLVLAQSNAWAEATDGSQLPPLLPAPILTSSMALPGLEGVGKWAGTPGESLWQDRSNLQASSGGRWSRLSTAKKTWIIVGIVVGAAAIVAVVSDGGSGKNGGGGY